MKKDATLIADGRGISIRKNMETTQSFTITLKQQLILLSLGVIKTSLFVVGCLYYFDWKITMPLYYGLAFLGLTDILPTIIVHIQYLIRNWKCALLLDTGDRILTYKSPGKSLEYSFDDINSLHYYFSYGRGSGWYSFESYRYCRIVFNDQSQVIVTCLMINKIEKKLGQLPGIDMDKHPRVLALIFNNKALARQAGGEFNASTIFVLRDP